MTVEMDCVRATMEESAIIDAKKSWQCPADSECLRCLHLLVADFISVKNALREPLSTCCTSDPHILRFSYCA